MIAHRLDAVRNCDTIFLLEKGRPYPEGPYDELVASGESFRRLAQVEGAGSLRVSRLSQIPSSSRL